MIIAFDDGPLDLVRMADAAQLAHLQRRYEIAGHGYRQQRLRTLQKAIIEMLQRTEQEGTPR